MKDLTIIFLTVNKVPEKWAEYHKQVLLEAIGDTPIITISKNPLDWGINLLQEEEPSVDNVYRQILRGAKLATTPYIAIAEDDTLYHKSHFQFRPDLDTFGYSGHRWGIFTWGKPFYYHKDRISNAAMIAPRELVIKSLEERFEKYPNSELGELGKEKGTNLNRYKTKIFWPEVGLVYFSHVNALDGTEQRKTKRPGVVQAYDIPYWGKAEELRKHFV
jgi:hypothetical protein